MSPKALAVLLPRASAQRASFAIAALSIGCALGARRGHEGRAAVAAMSGIASTGREGAADLKYGSRLAWGTSGASLRIAELLGDGESSKVYRGLVDGCRRVPEGISVAMKVIPRRVALNETQDAFHHRVSREINMMRALRDSGAVRYLSHIFLPKDAVVVMQLASCSMCAATLDQEYELDMQSIAHDILAALAALHGDMYAHRDIKLESLLLDCPPGEACRTLISGFDKACSLKASNRYECAGSDDPAGSSDTWPLEAWIGDADVWRTQRAQHIDVWMAGIALCSIYSRQDCSPSLGAQDADGEHEDDGLDVAARAQVSLAGHIADIIWRLEENNAEEWFVRLISRMLRLKSEDRCTAAECLQLVPVAAESSAMPERPPKRRRLDSDEDRVTQAAMEVSEAIAWARSLAKKARPEGALAAAELTPKTIRGLERCLLDRA